MNINANNNQVVNIPAAFASADAEFKKFKRFADAHSGNLEMRVQFNVNNELDQAIHEASALARAFKTADSLEARKANNDVRTALVKMVMRVCGVSEFDDLDPDIRAQFSGSKEHFTGEGSDMALDAQGRATSGRPLSVRRITNILNATTEYLKKSENNGPAINKSAEHPLEPVLLKDTLFREIDKRLKSLDKESPFLFTLDLEKSDAIRRLFSGLLDTFLDCGRFEPQAKKSHVSRRLDEFFKNVARQMPSGIGENEKEGLLRRIKEEVFRTIKELNAFEDLNAGKEMSFVCTQEDLETLKTEFASIGSHWKEPSLLEVFQRFAPAGTDAEFLRNPTKNKATAVKRILVALMSLPKSDEKLRNHLLSRFEIVFTKVDEEKAEDLQHWWAAFDFSVALDENETWSTPELLGRTLMGGEKTKVAMELKPLFSKLALSFTPQSFLTKLSMSKDLALELEVYTFLQTLDKVVANKFENGKNLASQLLSRLEDALNWMKDGKNRKPGDPIVPQTWWKAFGFDGDVPNGKGLVESLLEAERNRNVTLFRQLAPAGTDAEFLKNSRPKKAMMVGKILTALKDHLPEDVPNAAKVRDGLLSRLATVFKSVNEEEGEDVGQDSDELIEVNPDKPKAEDPQTWWTAFGFDGNAPADDVEPAALAKALLEAEEARLEKMLTENTGLFRQFAPEVTDTAFLENCKPGQVWAVNKILTALKELPKDVENGVELRSGLLARLETALKKVNEEDAEKLKIWWTAFGFDGNAPADDVEPAALAKALLEDEQAIERAEIIKENIKLFTRLAPEVTDTEFLGNCTFGQALAVNKLLTALDSGLKASFVYKGKEITVEQVNEDRKNLLGGLKTALTNIADAHKEGDPITWKTWWTAFGIREERLTETAEDGFCAALLCVEYKDKPGDSTGEYVMVNLDDEEDE